MDECILPDLFQLKCLVNNLEVKLAARIENGVKQLIALVLKNGDVFLYYTYGELPPVIRRIPWFTGKTKEIQAICFDNSASWLLAVTLNGSLYILPALSLVDRKQKVDCKWTLTDVTHFPKHSHTPESKPLCIVWWQTLECNQNALVGYENGTIALISLTDGRCIGICKINEEITKLLLFHDNNLDCVSLLINGKSGQQWRLILEQHSTGYVWPPESNNSSSQDSMTSRLQSLKQLGVDKLVSLKQRLSEGRNQRRDSQNSDSTSESSYSERSENSHNGPELLPHLCDTIFAPQYARNRYLFSAFYKPTALLTIHGVDIESAPLFVHRLIPTINYLLVTDLFIYCVHEDCKTLSVISSQLSECHLEGDAEFNGESLIAQFTVEKNEKIINIFKHTDITYVHDKRFKEDKRKDKEKSLILPNKVNDINITKPKVDTCLVISTHAIYKLVVKCSPIHKFVALVIEKNDLEKAEKLAVVFSLNLQQLLESCGDILISNHSFHQGLLLYKQAKTHLLKRVLKLAICGDSESLIKFVHLCLSVSKVDMSTPTKIHMGNLIVMAYIEQILRHRGEKRIENTKNFMNFLKHEEFYDQILAVNVACQAGQWNVVSLLAKSRGLQPEVVTAISQILLSASVHHEYTYEFLLALSEPCLTQSILIFPSYSQILLNFIRSNVDSFPLDILQRLLLQLDPSQPSALSLISRLMQQRKNSTSTDSFIESLDSENIERNSGISRELIECFILVLISLISKTHDDLGYSIDLLEKIDPPLVNNNESLIKKLPLIHPLGCGFEHAAIIRNNYVYSMGVSSSGCLGFGPLLIQSSPPKIVQTLAELQINAISVSCGRRHTLVISDYGVYSWGSNAFGQLGLGEEVQESPYPQIISVLSNVKIIDVAAGQYHSMALSASGNVYTWGWGIHGQLGHGSCDNQFIPKLLDLPQVIVQIAAGHAHSLVLTKDGKLFGFGSNAFGQLESNNLEVTKTTRPIPIFLLPDIYMPLEQIASAYFHNIAIRVDQEVYTWGASPQEMRLSQSKQNQKSVDESSTNKFLGSWKATTHVYSGSIKKPIEQVAVGFRHSAVLHCGKILMGKNLDEELSPPKISENDNMGILDQRFINVECGSDYTMAINHCGKVLAWGSYSMAQTLTGKFGNDDSKRSDGKVVIFKNTKRIIRLPHGIQNNFESPPIEVPNLPSMAITFTPLNHQTILSKPLSISIHSIENKTTFTKNNKFECFPFRYGPKTLHYVLETYYGFYDTETILTKVLQMKDYQSASKIAFLGGHYSDSFSFQLMAFKKHCKKFNLIFESLYSSRENKLDEILNDSNKYEVNNEKILNSPAHCILSASSSLDSLKQWTDEVENQGGRESPCNVSEIGEMRQTMAMFLNSVKTETSSPISNISKLILHKQNQESDLNKDDEVYGQIKDENTKEIVKQAFHIIEFYIQKIHSSENHILMQNILLKSIEFWLNNNLPVSVLENILLKNMDKYFYPLSILLFCKNFNNNFGEDILRRDNNEKRNTSANFLKEFSTKFCLQLCSMVLENVNKS